MIIYKVIARFGLDSELDSIIFGTYKAALEDAMLWFDQEDCDEVEIVTEYLDRETERFVSVRTATIKRPF